MCTCLALLMGIFIFDNIVQMAHFRDHQKKTISNVVGLLFPIIFVTFGPVECFTNLSCMTCMQCNVI